MYLSYNELVLNLTFLVGPRYKQTDPVIIIPSTPFSDRGDVRHLSIMTTHFRPEPSFFDLALRFRPRG